MITHAEFAELEERLGSVERVVREQANETLAGQFSLLRAYVASHQDEDLKAGMLSILAQLERRLRPLTTRLEARELSRVADSLDQVIPPHP